MPRARRRAGDVRVSVESVHEPFGRSIVEDVEHRTRGALLRGTSPVARGRQWRASRLAMPAITASTSATGDLPWGTSGPAVSFFGTNSGNMTPMNQTALIEVPQSRIHNMHLTCQVRAKDEGWNKPLPSDLILRSGPKDRVSKDAQEITIGAAVRASRLSRTSSGKAPQHEDVGEPGGGDRIQRWN